MSELVEGPKNAGNLDLIYLVLQNYKIELISVISNNIPSKSYCISTKWCMFKFFNLKYIYHFSKYFDIFKLIDLISQMYCCQRRATYHSQIKYLIVQLN